MLSKLHIVIKFVINFEIFKKIKFITKKLLNCKNFI